MNTTAQYAATMREKYTRTVGYVHQGRWRITFYGEEGSDRVMAIATSHGIRPETRVEIFATEAEARAWAEGLR